MENQAPQEEKSNSLFQNKTIKMLLIGFLTLMLLIPLEFVKDLINERSNRKKEVVEEVANLWGKDIYFYGPILKIPYRSIEEYNVTNSKTNVTTVQRKAILRYAYFFPEQLENKTTVKKNTSLKRGIYNNVVFTASMDFNGNFVYPNLQKINIKSEDMLWNSASIVVKTTNLKSIKSDLNIVVNQKKLAFESKPEEDSFYGTLESDKFDVTQWLSNKKMDFQCNFQYNGSNSIKFIPVGKTTKIGIDSDWESPSFEGAFAANDTTKSIHKNGFHVDWKILDINRSFAQQYVEKIPNLNEYAFGVKLIETVDQYQQNDRAAKYGFLVIGLTFLVFFLIQSISKIDIHIFQYSMIGLALIMFYTLLISITEHSSFQIAYLIAGIAVISMIGIYSRAILNPKFGIFISTALLGLYTFIYVIIQLESYALLVGSIGLFLILGAVMYFSRKIDWSTN